MFHFPKMDFTTFTEVPETTFNISDINNLIAWLEKKPADKEYNYADGRECLVYQYLTEAAGMDISHVTAGRFFLKPHTDGGNYPSAFNSIAYGGYYENSEHTFGAALRRAREYRDR